MQVLLIDLSPYQEPVTPITLGSLAATLQAQGHQTRLLSLGSESRFSISWLRSFLTQLSPDLVGLTTYQRNIFQALALARLAKEQVPDCRVALGGPQAMFLPEAALAGRSEVDFLCRGEGELAITAIAEVMAGATTPPIPGVSARTADGSWLTGPEQAPFTDLDRFPSPWLSGVLDPAAREESILLTSRGCPNRCVFCLTPAACGGRLRCHSIERTIEEISYVASRGSGRLWFADPNFSFDRRRVVAMLEGILQRGLQVSMWLETRADMLEPELLALMKRAGVHTLAMGLESAAPAVYQRLDKALEPEQVRAAAAAALAAGIDVELFCQYALPGECFEHAVTTLRFVRDSGVKIRGNSNAQQMQLYFGSEITADPAAYGITPLRDDLPPHLSVGDQYVTEWMSLQQIRQVKAMWRAASLDGAKRVVS